MGLGYSVSVLSSINKQAAEALAEEFSWSLDQQDADVILSWREGALTVHVQSDGELAGFKPTSFDFSQITVGDKKQALARACGLHKHPQRIMDTCAGTGVDAFILNRLKADVFSCERNPVIFSLLRDAYSRSGSPNGWSITCGDACQFLDAQHFDCAYCDPMFSSDTKRRGAERKEMRLLRFLEQGPNDSDQVLDKVAASSIRRMVVKRPLRSPKLQFTDRQLANCIEGKGFRFDVFDRH